MKYEQPEMEFIRFIMAQDVLTASLESDDGLFNGGLEGEGGSSGIGGVL